VSESLNVYALFPHLTSFPAGIKVVRKISQNATMYHHVKRRERRNSWDDK